MTIIPPIKIQGIKTKLIPHIDKLVPESFDLWVEPFAGSAVVGMNLAKTHAVFADTNPHIVNFYKYLKSIDSVQYVRTYLQVQSQILSSVDGYYYEVRDRFNLNHDCLDFLFLNRTCFNGLIRFNKSGNFNTPFCKKPNRLSKAYITKIVNQCDRVIAKLKSCQAGFNNKDFETTIIENDAESTLFYCDPPYIDRHSTYYDSWTADDEYRLCEVLASIKGKFILSTWIRRSGGRENKFIPELWQNFNITEVEHFYHVGGSEDNRRSIIEGLITNF